MPNLSRVALLREDVTASALPQIPARYEQQAAIAARALGLDVLQGFVENGGLMSYGVDVPEAQGLTVPPTLLLRADQMIE